LFIITFLFF